MPSASAADDSKSGDDDGNDKAENGEDDVEAGMGVADPRGVRVAGEGEHRDGVVGEDVGSETDAAVGEAVALDFFDEGAVCVRWG